MAPANPPAPPADGSDLPSDNSRANDAELLDVAEKRRAVADSFAWTVPGLAVAAEAFLLSIALSTSTEPAGRIVAVIAGGFAVAGALHFIGKQSYLFDLYDALIERQRERLGRMSMHREAIESLDFPSHVKGLSRRRSWLVKKVRAVLFWKILLLTLMGINALILFYAIYELWRGDPGWLSGQ